MVKTTQSGHEVLKNEHVAAADDKVVSQLGLSQRLDMEDDDEELLLKIKARHQTKMREMGQYKAEISTDIPCTKKFTTNPVLSLKKEKTKRLLQLQPGPLLDVVRTTQSGHEVLKNGHVAAANDKVVSQLGLSQRCYMKDGDVQRSRV